jgi:hypothetical protein
MSGETLAIVAVCISCTAFLAVLVMVSRPATAKAEWFLVKGDYRSAFRVAVSSLHIIPWPWLGNPKLVTLVGRWLADTQLLHDIAAEALYRGPMCSPGLTNSFEELSRRLTEARMLVQSALSQGRGDYGDKEWDRVIVEFARTRHEILRLAMM